MSIFESPLRKKPNIRARVRSNTNRRTLRKPQCSRLVVRKVDNAIYRISHYPVNSVVCFVNIYPLDSDLAGG